MVIEKDIPIPPKGSEARGKWKRTAEQMEIGDSVRVETYTDQENLRSLLFKLGRKAASRKMDGAYRVWRTE